MNSSFLTTTFSILRWELRLFFRDPKTLIPSLIVLALILGVNVFLSMNQAGFQIVANQLLLCGMLPAGLLFNLASDSFAGEKERHTLDTLLCLPIPASTLFFGKLLSVFTVPFIISLLAQFCMLLVFKDLDFIWELLAKSLTLSFSLQLLIGTFSLHTSVKSQSARQAVQINAGVFSILFMGTILASYWLFIGWSHVLPILLGSILVSGLLIVQAYRLFHK